jgi:hypothetical protein
MVSTIWATRVPGAEKPDIVDLLAVGELALEPAAAWKRQDASGIY